MAARWAGMYTSKVQSREITFDFCTCKNTIVLLKLLFVVSLSFVTFLLRRQHAKKQRYNTRISSDSSFFCGFTGHAGAHGAHRNSPSTNCCSAVRSLNHTTSHRCFDMNSHQSLCCVGMWR